MAKKESRKRKRREELEKRFRSTFIILDPGKKKTWAFTNAAQTI
jgi:hypothetical protein